MPRRKGSETVRREVVNKILDAIRTTEKIASEPTEPANRIRWYQVMGYLAQTLDGLLRNVDQTDSEKQLAELKEIVVKLQERSTGNTGPSPGPTVKK